MPLHYSKTPRFTRSLVLIMAVLGVSTPTKAGFLTGDATEWTQLANNAELVEILKSSGVQVEHQLTQITQLAQQIENQMKIYQNMLQNTAMLPAHMWEKVADDLNALRMIVHQGQGISFSMESADSVLKERFRPYADLRASTPSGSALATTYAEWSSTNRDTIAGALRAASWTAEQFDNEDDTMRGLKLLSDSADGQLKALQVGHEMAAQEVAQLQKLRGLVAQQMTMMGTWLQSQQTSRDLNAARLEKFFNAEVTDIPKGQNMEPRW